jgi:hypothetical protein
MQVLVNGGGFACMIAMAVLLERQRHSGVVPGPVLREQARWW